MANQWLRLWHDMPNDPKWRTIAKASGQRIGDVVAVCIHLLVCGSANATERGRTQSFNSEDVASALDLGTDQVEAIHAAMQKRILDGDWLQGWDKRQPAREDGSAERSKAWREDQKEAKRTQANASERERALDKDKTKIKKKDQKPSSADKPPTGGQDDVSAKKEERVTQITRDAIAAYNASQVTKPEGLLAKLKPTVGFDARRNNVRRCLRVAREICADLFQGDTTITPAFWEGYFELVNADDFKSGRQEPGKGHKNWVPDFEYLTREDVMLEVYDKSGVGEEEAA